MTFPGSFANSEMLHKNEVCHNTVSVFICYSLFKLPIARFRLLLNLFIGPLCDANKFRVLCDL